MKGLKKGPELKMPELKVPAFLSDLYWDLRDRHLLPLVGLAVVAIIAVPFLLGGGSEEEVPALPATTGALEGGARASSLTVVESKPGLRDYRKRLRGRSATDPFKQRYTSATLKGTKLGGGEDEGGSGSSSSTSFSKTTTTKTTKEADGETTTTVKTETDDSKTTTGNDGPDGAEPEIALFSFAIKVRTTRIAGDAESGKKKSKPNVRDHVLPPAPLPSAKQAVVTYMGISPKTKKPLLLVSDEVSAVFGDGKCLSGNQTCQLIEVDPGFPETFVYGPNSVRYKVEVVKVEPVIAGKY